MAWGCSKRMASVSPGHGCQRGARRSPSVNAVGASPSQLMCQSGLACSRHTSICEGVARARQGSVAWAGSVLLITIWLLRPRLTSAMPSLTCTPSSLTDSPGSSAKRTRTGAWLTARRLMRVWMRQRSCTNRVRSTNAKLGRASGTCASSWRAAACVLVACRSRFSTLSTGRPPFRPDARQCSPTIVSTCGLIGRASRMLLPAPIGPPISTTWMPAGSSAQSLPLSSRRLVAGLPSSSSCVIRQLSVASWPGRGTCTCSWAWIDSRSRRW